MMRPLRSPAALAMLATLLAATAPVAAQTLVLENFNNPGAAGGIIAGTRWVGNVTRNADTITIGGNAGNNNGWGASNVSLYAGTTTSLTLTAQRDSGNVASFVNIAFVSGDTLATHIVTVPTSSFAVGTLTAVTVPIAWPGGFATARITDWSIGGGEAPPGTQAFRLTLGELSLGGGNAIAILAQPANSGATPGSTAVFQVTVAGTPAPTLQWQRQAAGTTGFTSLSDGGAYSGATPAVLTISPVAAGMAGDEFRCIATNAAGAATSSAATLTLTAAPAITSAASAVFVVGTASTFNITATGSPLPVISLQGTLPAGITFSANPAGGTATLSGNATTASSTPFALTITATNSAGPAVTQNLTVHVGVPPAITVQPVSQAFSEGAGLLLIVGASGTATLTYQWKKGGNDIAGASSATFTLSSVAQADAGSYTVTVTNAIGTATSNAATVTILPAGFSATHALVGLGYPAGGTVTIANTLTYSGTLTALGWNVLLPTGWSFASATSGQVQPAPGTTSLMEIAWTTLPVSPHTFSYTLNVPAGATGTQALVALMQLRQNNIPYDVVAKPDPLLVPKVAFHSADTVGATAGTPPDSRLNLAELLRVIELYNTRNGTVRTGGYRVQDGTEDGFASDATRTSTDTITLTRYHSADTVGASTGTPRDGRLNLAELLRVIELYNYRAGTVRTGQYRVQSGTEDGFAPGP